MEIYLVRHTKPLIENDVCYGQTDVPVDEIIFESQATNILAALPMNIDVIFSSPLQRCSLLASFINEHQYHNAAIEYSDLLKEVHFGDWENTKWNDINQKTLNLWMEDFVTKKPPNGESFIHLHQRTKYFLDNLGKQPYPAIAIITHAGIIRSLTCHIQKIELANAFSINCKYGSVSKLLFK